MIQSPLRRLTLLSSTGHFIWRQRSSANQELCGLHTSQCCCCSSLQSHAHHQRQTGFRLLLPLCLNGFRTAKASLYRHHKIRQNFLFQTYQMILPKPGKPRWQDQHLPHLLARKPARCNQTFQSPLVSASCAAESCPLKVPPVIVQKLTVHARPLLHWPLPQK